MKYIKYLPFFLLLSQATQAMDYSKEKAFLLRFSGIEAPRDNQPIPQPPVPGRRRTITPPPERHEQHEMLQENFLERLERNPDAETFYSLLAQGLDVNYVHDDQYPRVLQYRYGKRSILHRLIHKREIARLLIENGADVNYINGVGESALHRAAERGDRSIIRLLLDRGADIDRLSHLGETALSIALDNGKREEARILLEGGATFIHPIDLITAISRDFTDIISLLLERGVDVNYISPDRSNALLHILDSGSGLSQPDLVMTIINQTDDVNSAHYLKNERTSPLIQAIESGNRAAINALLAKGVDINFVNDEGITPLTAAIFEGFGDVVESLIARQVDIDFINRRGETALIRAILENEEGIALTLVAHNANINLGSRRYSRYSPLMLALNYKLTSLAHKIMEKNPDLTIITKRGNSALTIALRRGYPEIAIELINKGADINITNSRGETPLSIARSKGYEEVVRLLQEKGA